MSFCSCTAPGAASRDWQRGPGRAPRTEAPSRRNRLLRPRLERPCTRPPLRDRALGGAGSRCPRRPGNRASDGRRPFGGGLRGGPSSLQTTPIVPIAQSSSATASRWIRFRPYRSWPGFGEIRMARTAVFSDVFSPEHERRLTSAYAIRGTRAAAPHLPAAPVHDRRDASRDRNLRRHPTPRTPGARYQGRIDPDRSGPPPEFAHRRDPLSAHRRRRTRRPHRSDEPARRSNRSVRVRRAKTLGRSRCGTEDEWALGS